VEFRILGPIEVRDDERVLGLGAGQQKALLAVLLLRANETVSRDQLIHELWGERPPSTAAKALQGHVSALRKQLEPGRALGAAGSVILTRGAGYELRLESEQLDLRVFECLREQARGALAQGEPERAAARLREALALWRGPPLADFAYEPFAQAEIARLEELRIATLEDRLEADLASGRHRALVGELGALVKEQPLRERLRAQLMLALYRAGRQAEALEAYQAARQALVDELGIEPGRELRELHQAILRQDPALDPEPQPPTRRLALRAGRREREPARPSRRSRKRVVVGLVALLPAALAGVVALLLLGDDGNASSSRVPSRQSATTVAPNSVAVIDPRTGRVVDGIAVGRAPGPIAIGEGAVWVGNAEDRTVSRIDPKTRTVVTTIGLGIEPTGLAVANGAVWVAGGFDQALVRIDTADNVVRLKRTVRPKLGPLPAGYERGPSAVAVGAGAVWLAHGEEVSRIDPRTARVLATIPAGGSWSGSIAFGEGAVWVPESASKKTRQRKDDDDDGVSRIDPASNAVAVTLPVVATPRGVAVGQGSVWAVVPGNDTLWQIDPQANRVARTLNAGWDPWGVAVGEGAVWIENDNDRTVSRIDPRSGELSATIDVGNPLEDIAAGEGAVWVSVR
jgi:YVTN family beta-propeller protein